MRPRATCFAPTGVSEKSDSYSILMLDELEALRLADLIGLYHEQAAHEMGISRATFGRIVEEARRKIADALVNGRTLLIDGGNTEIEGENEMPRRDGTGPESGEKGGGLGPCGCGQRRGQKNRKPGSQFRRGCYGRCVENDSQDKKHDEENLELESEKETNK
jgi:predicted DNA-binding protein (UPF0251 family)